MVIASIVFDQGGPGPAGEAFEGVVSSLVTVTNDDNTDVASWTITLTDVPSGSALATGVLATAVSNTPMATFTPDVTGCYRIQLVVHDVGLGQDEDIRNFGIRNSRGIFVPPFQKLPDPRPLLGTGEPGEKPDELNFGGQTRGWAGGPSDGLMEEFFETYDDLVFRTVTSTSATISVSGPPLTYVDLETAGGTSTITLPASPRVGQQCRIMAVGTTAGRTVIVQPSGGGSINSSFSSITIPLNGGGTFVAISGNNWRMLGNKADIYERTIVGGLETTDQTGWVVVGSTFLDPADFVNTTSTLFEAVLETTDAADAAEIRLYNTTTDTVVASSTLSTTNLFPTLVSASITLAAGTNLYEAQLRLATTGNPNRASCKQAQIKINWLQV